MTTHHSLPGYEQALSMILAAAPALGEEEVGLAQGLGRVLRESVMADRDQPPFDRSAMDGFAVRSGEIRAGAKFAVRGRVPAGGSPETYLTPVEPGTVRRIATGAPLPVGADAVIQIELAELEGAGAEEVVSFKVGSIPGYNNIHRRGVDVARGGMVLEKGTRLGVQHIGIAASVGRVTLKVAQLPRISIITSGDEIVGAETGTEALELQQIRNSNGPMLTAFLQAMGDPPVSVVHVPDEPEEILAAAREAASRSHLVITNGGVSAGERDYLPAAWKHLGFTAVLHGVAIQPGRPVFVTSDPCKLVLGLPGNPVSVLCTAHLFLWPLLLEMSGEKGGLPWREVTLANSVKGSSKRQVFRAARLVAGGKAEVVEWHGSGDLAHTAKAEGFVRLPLSDEVVEAGRKVEFLGMVG